VDIRLTLKAWTERLEMPIIALAAVAVGLYLAGLGGVWTQLGVDGPIRTLSLAIDLVFVADLVIKIYALRGEYLRSPWFVIDAISAVPVLSSIQLAPTSFTALRFVRGFRLFRVLGALRVLRSLRMLRALQLGKKESNESPSFKRTLVAAVVIYTALFLAIVTVVRHSSPEGHVVAIDGVPLDGPIALTIEDAQGQQTELEIDPRAAFATAERAELLLVLGSVLGMLLVLVVVRFQIPDITTRHVRALLNVALPRQVARHFLENASAKPYEELYVRMPATVMFADIRGFTSTVEQLGGDLLTLKRHLERAMDAVVDVHLQQDLIVDKFIGDAIMSFRGGDLVEGDAVDNAWRVVRAGLDSVAVLEALGDPYFRAIKIGGASAPDALIGTFGTSTRLSYTVLGDRVNLAARLEAACGTFGTRTLFCDQTHAMLKDRPELAWRRLGGLRAAGKAVVHDVYEAFDANAEDLAWIEAFHDAVALWERAAFVEAAAAFRAVDSARIGGDAPSVWYVRQCEQLIQDGAPRSWTPVLTPSK
jgi:adenylate cyclase